MKVPLLIGPPYCLFNVFLFKSLMTLLYFFTQIIVSFLCAGLLEPWGKIIFSFFYSNSFLVGLEIPQLLYRKETYEKGWPRI